ncbi:reverse transcriptase domain-containing protein [Enterococcus cecorum]|nr:reverse transcriptase domain-containing protein [Enterococcus cecorum]CAI3250563.1 group II intron reverse transcriptase/maturase [Enterococcus cecorum]CAI3257347.1 group II intron reverse transcriptase/maturase [Enterococcus cecorum]CAI3290038.1 group II intron reverse transcriptase/maturase [Enterococcus cecorum]CAI3310256.1 group II intron reverse transcriptase/maturase [Enterococcus cecorum]CAI3311390.1 group II intron reverse transcriptase/maturase [Enterococcus cecorum]
MAIEQTILYLNEGYEWVIDIDIEKYFDTVNHDKLISILIEKINDVPTLNLIRKFLRAGIMDDGLISESTMGVPQGGPLSPILSNVYLDKLDKELENRGLKFARCADDCNIFVKSERAADRVIKSITQWLEKKLRLKVNLTKSKVVRPTKSEFLGFSFYKSSNKAGWRCRPAKNRTKRLKEKIKTVLCRRKAVARPLEDTITKLNQIIMGWINYYRISDMKNFLKEFGPWMRHKLRVVIMKMWKRPKTKYKRLSQLRNYQKYNISDEQIRQVANSRLGLYRQCGMSVVNFLLSPEVLEKKIGKKPALINPIKYYEKQRLSL